MSVSVRPQGSPLTQLHSPQVSLRVTGCDMHLSQAKAIILISSFFPNIYFCNLEEKVLDQASLWLGAICCRPGTPPEYSGPVNRSHPPLHWLGGRDRAITFVTRAFSLGSCTSGRPTFPSLQTEDLISLSPLVMAF